MTTVLEARELWKVYDTGTNRVEALRKVSVSLTPGEMVAVMGPSGCGKTTVSKIIMRALDADSGQVFYNDNGTTIDLMTLGDKAMIPLRNSLFRIFRTRAAKKGQSEQLTSRLLRPFDKKEAG